MDIGKLIDGYIPTDTFFEGPYIDRTEERDVPSPHLYLHGGYEGTGTRFSLYFPPADVYDGRFIQPLEGGLGGSEHSYDSVDGVIGKLIGGFDFALSVGAYMVESNQGHVGAEDCPKAGKDSTIYSYRASAEVARLGSHIAEQHYGLAPHHGYVFGGSGGSVRGAMCIENVHDVWAGALTFMGATAAPSHDVGPPGAVFSTLYNAMRVLGPQLAGIVDAVEPGGSGDPLEHLTGHQRQALQALYRDGFPRGVEYMIAAPMGQISAWAWSAEQWRGADPDYYDHDFWNEPGYLGHDEPQHLETDLIDQRRVKVERVLTARELGGRTLLLGKPDLACGVVLEGITTGSGFLQGASIKVATGRSAGRQLWCTGVLDGEKVLLVDSIGEAGNLRLDGVEVGDEVVIDNTQFLAYCYRHRHLVNVDDPAQAHLVVDGKSLYPKRPAPAGPTMGGHMGAPAFEGKFQGKVLTVQHSHDSSIWPRNHQFPGGEDRWVLRWTENAEHVPASAVPQRDAISPLTRLIDWKGTIEQSLHDLVAWVEHGVKPLGSHGVTIEPGGPLVFPATAAERGGIQPVVTALANGGTRTEVAAGGTVRLSVEAEVPVGAGTIIGIAWDFDGRGAFPYSAPDVDGTEVAMTSSVDHSFTEAGTYFPAVKVTAHRDGDLGAVGRRIENIARVRVIVS
jgi:hypothetical protein